MPPVEEDGVEEHEKEPTEEDAILEDTTPVEDTILVDAALVEDTMPADAIVGDAMP
jgi:hypothetical protein